MVDSAPVQAITNEQDKHFDYDLVQSLYLKACSEYFTDPNNLTGPWTHAVRSDIISSIKTGQKGSLSIYNLDRKLLSFCQPVLENGEDKLVIQGTATEILCYEDCFDVFVDFHKITNHGNMNAMQTLLADNFYINKKCLDYFLENCNVCEKFKKKRHPVVFNDHVIVEIHRAPYPDESCHYILYYMDLATKFKLFRPLLSYSEDEVAIEMIKIFTDFGPPQQLETIHSQFFKNILSMIARGGFKYSISLYESRQVIGEPIIKDNVQSTHWATTCLLIQYDHNNNKMGLNPMDKIFYSNDSKTYYSEKLNKEKIQETNDGSISDLEEAHDNLFLNQNETGRLQNETKTGNSEINHITDNTCETEHNTEMCVEDNYVLEYTETPIDSNTTENVLVKDEVTIEETELIRPVEETLTDLTDLNTNIPDLTNVNCSVCKGKMFTDFFCVYCRSPTHIFCMKRVINPVENTEPLVSNTYCNPCYEFLQLSITEK